MATQYEKLSMVGSGTFGKVWLVRDKATGRRCVIKEVSVANMTEKTRNQTLTEVEVLARCRHINVIRYKETFINNGCLNIAMSYAEGGDLHARIQNQHGVYFDEKIIIDWFVQICFALRYIHGMNILHRDLKTHNIFLSGENIIKIGDFGIARVLTDTADLASTAVGTPYYLSPEICQQQQYDSKSDMWAAGCVLYELCSLRPPFDGHNFAALVIRILNGTYEPLPRSYSATVEDLVTVLLREDAASRPSADQVLWVPALQTYVRAHVARSTALVNKQKQLSPVPFLQQPSSCPTSMVTPEEKENINPRSGKPKGRRLSLATPKSEALHRIDNRRVVSSADGVRKAPRKIKGTGAPTMSLYKEVLRRAINKSPQMHTKKEERGKKIVFRPSKLSARTYRIHRDTTNSTSPIHSNKEYASSGTSKERDNQKPPSSPAETAANYASPTSPHPFAKIVSFRRAESAPRSATLSRPSSSDVEIPQDMVDSACQDPDKSSIQQKVSFTSGEKMVVTDESVDRNAGNDVERLRLLYNNFCKDQASSYPLMESLRGNLEIALGSNVLSILHKKFRDALGAGLPLENCIKGLSRDKIKLLPQLLILLQLEVVADI